MRAVATIFMMAIITFTACANEAPTALAEYLASLSRIMLKLSQINY